MQDNPALVVAYNKNKNVSDTVLTPSIALLKKTLRNKNVQDIDILRTPTPRSLSNHMAKLAMHKNPMLFIMTHGKYSKEDLYFEIIGPSYSAQRMLSFFEYGNAENIFIGTSACNSGFLCDIVSRGYISVFGKKTNITKKYVIYATSDTNNVGLIMLEYNNQFINPMVIGFEKALDTTPIDLSKAVFNPRIEPEASLLENSLNNNVALPDIHIKLEGIVASNGSYYL